MTGAALEELDLSTVLAALREQEAGHGHTAESDAARPIADFANKITTRSHELADVLRPGDRQNLDVALRRAAKLAAYAVATMRRIRVEQERKGAPNER